MDNFRNKPIDRRRLNMRDRSDLSRGGEYLQQSNAFKRAKALNAQNKMIANRDQRTTTQRPGTGGFTGGLWQQQERLAQRGKENQRQESLRSENLIKGSIAGKSFSVD